MKQKFIIALITLMSMAHPAFALDNISLANNEITMKAHKGQDELKAFKGENKKEFEDTLKERKNLRKEIATAWEAKLGVRKESKEEIREYIKTIKDRVDKGELTKEEGIEIIKDKRISEQEYWKDLSEEGKKEFKAIDEKLNKQMNELKTLKVELKDLIKEGNESKINEHEKKYISAMKEHNKLLKQKLDIIKKYSNK